MGNKSQTSDREKFVEMLNKGEIEDIYIKVGLVGFVFGWFALWSFFFVSTVLLSGVCFFFFEKRGEARGRWFAHGM